MYEPSKHWKFTKYNALTTESAEQLYEDLVQQSELLAHAKDSVFAEWRQKTIACMIETFYDLGKVIEVFKMAGGEINQSFGFVAEKDGVKTQYFLRKYNRFADENVIELEHDFLGFLKENGLEIIPGIMPNKEGKTYIQNEELGNTFFYAVYEFLDGEDHYRWFHDTVTPDVCYNIGKTTGEFHRIASYYDTSQHRRQEPGVYFMMDEFKSRFTEWASRDVDSIFHRTFCHNLEEIMETIDRIQTELSPEFVESLPKVTVNGDLHQGNMKYDSEGNVVGLFDFDWVKTDTRLFEIAGVLFYLTASWQDHNDGEPDMIKAEAFIKGYQEVLHNSSGKIDALNEEEARALPFFLEMVCIYNVVNWTAQDHYQIYDRINVFEYDYYLKHGLRCRRAFERLSRDFTEIVLGYQ